MIRTQRTNLLRLVAGLVAIVAAGAMPGTAPAQAIGSAITQKQVLAGTVRLDPAKGYVFLNMEWVTTGTLLRVPDQTTYDTWAKDREAAFANAMKRFRRLHDKWLEDADLARKTSATPPPEPETPTLETFGFDPVETRDMVTFGPESAFARGDRRSYLTVVKPGTYIWYSHDGFNGGSQAPDGVCFCMGSVRFEVKPGVITDLGNWIDAAPRWNDDLDVGRLVLRKAAEKRRAAGKAPETPPEPGPVVFGLPPSLKDWPAVQAEFHANQKINNYLGLIVSRIAPVPGVLAYARDNVIDVRTGTTLPNPTMTTMLKIRN